MAASVQTFGSEDNFSDNTANLFRAAIPYADKNQAKVFALAAGVLEFKQTLEHFHAQDNDLAICSVPDQKPDPEELLCDLRKYCDPGQAETIDKILGMLKMGRLYEKYQTLLKSPEFSKIISSLSPENGQVSDTPHRPLRNHEDIRAKDNPSPPELENTLKSMLSPNQLAMFEQLKNSLASGE